MESFIMTWSAIGPMKWPITFSFFFVVALTLWSATRLIGPPATADLRTKAWVDGILFWGGFAAISGFLGSIVGVIITLQAIESAGEVTTTLVAGGWKVALLSTSAGLALLAIAGLSWFVLKLRWSFVAARKAESAA